jgi:hypothetical protein
MAVGNLAPLSTRTAAALMLASVTLGDPAHRLCQVDIVL